MEQINYKDAYENVMIANKMLAQEIERLQNVIKEAREYIEEHSYDYRIGGIAKVNGKELLDILDKENGDGNNKEKPNSGSKN